jgi:hypothetical protein
MTFRIKNLNINLKRNNVYIFLEKKNNTYHIEQGFRFFRHLSHTQYPYLELLIGLKQLLHDVYIVVDCCIYYILFLISFIQANSIFNS